MYTERNILYFTPFYFKNGNPSKSKYFVVLKIIGGKTILASLPTSKDSIPAKEVVESGCLELPDINLNCFIISSKIPVTECGKCMPVSTFIYGYELDTYELKFMNDQYKIENSDYEIFGKMKTETFEELIKCLKTSKAVKMKYVRALG